MAQELFRRLLGKGRTTYRDCHGRQNSIELLINDAYTIKLNFAIGNDRPLNPIFHCRQCIPLELHATSPVKTSCCCGHRILRLGKSTKGQIGLVPLRNDSCELVQRGKNHNRFGFVGKRFNPSHLLGFTSCFSGALEKRHLFDLLSLRELFDG